MIKIGIVVGSVVAVLGTAAFVWSQTIPSNPWERDTAWQAPVDFKYGGIFAELNGDGLPDILLARDARGAATGAVLRAAYINNGKKGWVEDSRWTPPQGITFYDSAAVQPSGSVPVDINGDGLTDIVRSDEHTKLVYLNTGEGWEDKSEQWATWGGGHVIERGRDGGLRFQDLNGDGLVDAISSHRDPYNPDNIATWVYLNKGR